MTVLCAARVSVCPRHFAVAFNLRILGVTCVPACHRIKWLTELLADILLKQSKVVPVKVTKVCNGNRGIYHLIINLGARWK